MNSFSETLYLSASALKINSLRMRTSAENVANINTPGFRRKMVSQPHEISLGKQFEGDVGRISLKEGPLPEIYDPHHPMASNDGYRLGSNVNLVIELADARAAQRSYQANLNVFAQTRKMASSLNEILRS